MKKSYLLKYVQENFLRAIFREEMKIAIFQDRNERNIFFLNNFSKENEKKNISWAIFRIKLGRNFLLSNFLRGNENEENFLAIFPGETWKIHFLGNLPRGSEGKKIVTVNFLRGKERGNSF